jgi:hypothetical protein
MLLAAMGFLGACSTAPIVKSEAWPASAQTPTEVTAYYALPRAFYNLKITRTKCAVEIGIDDKTPVKYLPDIQRRYVLRHQDDDWSNDTFVIETDAQGLLKNVNGTSENQSSAVASGVLDLATQIVTAPGSPIKALDGGKTPVCDPAKDLDIAYAFDPTDTTGSLSSLKQRLPPDLLIDIDLPTARADQSLKTRGCPDEQDGVCFPPARLYEVEIKAVQVLAGPNAAKNANGVVSKKITRTFNVVAPDPKQLLFVSLKRRGAAKLDVKLSFENGMLVKNESTYASPVLGVVQWPSAVVKSALGLSSAVSSANPPKK